MTLPEIVKPPQKEPIKRERKQQADAEPSTDVVSKEIELEPYWSAILDAATD